MPLGSRTPAHLGPCVACSARPIEWSWPAVASGVWLISRGLVLLGGLHGVRVAPPGAAQRSVGGMGRSVSPSVRWCTGGLAALAGDRE